MITYLLRRIRSRIRRYAKRHGHPERWFRRWNAACSHCWDILSSGEASRQRFERFQRHHAKLMALADRRYK
jgi:hypothetical protein